MGRDKASLQVGGETLLDRTLREVARLTHDIVIVGGERGIPDLYPHSGPLGGLVTGLGAISGNRAVVVACDQPFLRAEVLRLLADLASGYDAVVPRVGDRIEPLHAVYGKDVWAVAERQVRHGSLRLSDLLALLNVRWVDEAAIRAVDPDALSLTNVNTPEEWEAARNLLDTPPASP